MAIYAGTMYKIMPSIWIAIICSPLILLRWKTK